MTMRWWRSLDRIWLASLITAVTWTFVLVLGAPAAEPQEPQVPAAAHSLTTAWILKQLDLAHQQTMLVARFTEEKTLRLLARPLLSRGRFYYKPGLRQGLQIARVIDGRLEGTHLPVLTPGRERVRERLAVLPIWIDAGSFLPRRVAYEKPDGDSTVLTFHGAQPSVDLATHQFEVDLPSEAVISSTFNEPILAQGGR